MLFLAKKMKQNQLVCVIWGTQYGFGFRLVYSMGARGQPSVWRNILILWSLGSSIFSVWSQSSPAEQRGCPGNTLNREEGQRAVWELMKNIRALCTAPASPRRGPLVVLNWLFDVFGWFSPEIWKNVHRSAQSDVIQIAYFCPTDFPKTEDIQLTMTLNSKPCHLRSREHHI